MNSPTGMQAMMAYWERLHAINAVQVAEVSAEITIADLQTATDRLFRKFLAASSGQWPSLSERRAAPNFGITAQFHKLPSIESSSLESLATQLLNAPFADDEPPFRVGLVQQMGTRYVWLSYRHSIADARSIAMLLQNLLEELMWDRDEELPLGITHTTESLVDFFPEEARRTNVLRSIGPAIKTLWNLRRSHRRPPADPTEFEMTFQIHAEHLPLASLRNRAKELKVTVGELVISAMLDWFIQQDRELPKHFLSPNRCISVLADLVGRATPKRNNLFGQFLAPLNISANSYRQQSFEGLVHHVRQSVVALNSITQNLRTLNGLRINSFLVQQVSRAFANWYQEFLFPISGALSNINLPAILPPPRTALPVVNYFRGTCATQFSPMILCLTTIKDTCTLTSSHRNSVYSDDEMRALSRHVMKRAFGMTADCDLANYCVDNAA
ncbi:MAG: hypothetical protein NT013_21470 [Planctomycetia bacterium]|nr:hypothetical protein [Planctomycetia bacterium]